LSFLQLIAFIILRLSAADGLIPNAVNLTPISGGSGFQPRNKFSIEL